MRRIITLFLVFMLIALCGCGKNSMAQATNSAKENIEQSETTPTELNEGAQEDYSRIKELLEHSWVNMTTAENEEMGFKIVVINSLAFEKGKCQYFQYVSTTTPTSKETEFPFSYEGEYTIDDGVIHCVFDNEGETVRKDIKYTCQDDTLTLEVDGEVYTQ